MHQRYDGGDCYLACHLLKAVGPGCYPQARPGIWDWICPLSQLNKPKSINKEQSNKNKKDSGTLVRNLGSIASGCVSRALTRQAGVIQISLVSFLAFQDFFMFLGHVFQVQPERRLVGLAGDAVLVHVNDAF